MTKDEILAKLPEHTQEELKNLGDNLWAEYIEFIKDYKSGGWAPDGWQFLIEANMQMRGASQRQAFLLAALRYDL